MPWQGIWQRVGDTGGIDIVSQGSESEPERERPAGWSVEQEAALPEAAGITPTAGGAGSRQRRGWHDRVAADPGNTRGLSKCALVAVALPHALMEFVDYPKRELNEKFLGPPKLRELLARGDWKWPVTTGDDVNSRPIPGANRKPGAPASGCCPRARCYRTATERLPYLYFDMRGPFSPSAVDSYTGDKNLLTATTQGEALLGLIGGFDATAFERFERLKELIETGFIEDLSHRRCQN